MKPGDWGLSETYRKDFHQQADVNVMGCELV